MRCAIYTRVSTDTQTSKWVEAQQSESARLIMTRLLDHLHYARAMVGVKPLFAIFRIICSYVRFKFSAHDR